jgi:PAS domain S-box-containing protein
MKKIFLSIRPHLTLLVLVGLVPALVIILYSGMERRDHDVKIAHERVVALARGLVAKQDGITASTFHMLKALAQVPEVQNLDSKVCKKIFADVQKKNPMYSIIAIAKPDGKMFASSVPFKPGLNFSDRKYFREAVITKDFAIGEYSIGRITKLPTFHYAYPLLDTKKNLVGVVFAGFKLDMYKDFMTPREKKEGFVIGITDHTGIRLYRYPDQDSEITGIGAIVSPSSLNHVLDSSSEGTFEGVGSDGTLRLYAFHKLHLSESSPPYMCIIAGVSKEKALLEADTTLWRNLVQLGLTAFMALFLTWIFGNITIVDRLNKLLSASRRFGSGDLSIRTGLSYDAGEFGQLAKAFDEMATSLETREKELLESEELYRTLAGKSFAGVYVVQNGIFRYINDNAASFAGYLPEDLIGIKSDSIIHHEDRDMVKENARKMLRGGRNFPYEFRIIGKQKQIRWIMETVASITFDGKPAILGNSMDITEQKQAQEVQNHLEAQLSQAQKMEAIGTLAGGIAHDFNNILTAVICNAEMACEEAKKKKRREHLNEVLHASYRAKDLISRILTFSRQQEQKKHPVQINLIVREGIKLLRSSIPTTIQIRQKIISIPTMVLADPTQIYQILLNLCTNAADAMLEKGGTMDVHLSHVNLSQEEIPHVHGLKPGNYAKLTVADTGRGIDPAIIDRIFDPFFSTKAPGKGTGLGLSVVYGIVKDHNGAVDVFSEPEKGTSFSVYLPLLEVSEEVEEKEDEPIPSGNERILFVDDEPILVNTGEQVLSSLGYQVTAMRSSVGALEAFHKRPDTFDLVITDMIMPGMTGVELATIMREIRPDVPIILSTGFSESVTEEKVKSLGIRRLMMKPFSKRSMAKVVREVLDNKQEIT